MQVAIIGHGAIATYVRQHLPHGITETAQIVCSGKEAHGKEAPGDPPRISEVDDLPMGVDLVVDCGGHAALVAHGPAALARGIDVLTVSLGALANQALYDLLQNAAKTGRTKLHLASGAIGGLDALRAACAATNAFEAAACGR